VKSTDVDWPRPEQGGATHVIVDETDAQRLDREHDQLNQELRALITGVQVLFGFLLSVTFTERFGDLSVADRRVHLLVIGCSATALVLLLAPTAFHRVQFRQRDKEAMVRIANTEAKAAMLFMSLATAGSLYLVGRLSFSSSWGVITGCSLFVFSLSVWWGIPLVRRHQRSR
jgi:hypothetical protein